MRDKIKKNHRGHKDIFMHLSLKSPFALQKQRTLNKSNGIWDTLHFLYNMAKNTRRK